MSTSSLTVVNGTPLAITLVTEGTGGPSVALAPYERRDYRAGSGDRLVCREAVSGLSLGTFVIDDGQTRVDVTTAGLRSATTGGPVTVDIENATPWHVDVSWLNYEGVEQRYDTALPPNDTESYETGAMQVWIVRATFTREVLGVYVASTAPTQTFKVLGVRRPQLPPSVTGFPRLTTIGDVRDTPGPESKTYISISETKNPPRDVFNLRKNVATKTVKVVGVRVQWTKESGLLGYQGEGANDIEALEIYADEVVVRSPVRLPRTNVTIYARELVFAGNGCIDTTPLAYTVKASSPNKVKIGDVEVPADADGKPTYVAKNGEHGEPAGDITLYVRSIREDAPGPKRLVARGANGQDAEDGGLKPYAPKAGQTYRPPAEHGKNLTAVRATDINGVIQNHFVESRVNYWHWPGGQWWPENIPMQGNALNNGNVVHVKLVSYDDTLGMGPIGVAFLPSGKIPDFIAGPARKATEARQIATTDESRLRPGDGEDAYASGQPGNGGKGGTILSNLASAPIDDRLVDVSGGAPGAETTTIEGGPAGTPNPAYWLTLTIVKYDPIAESDRNPSLSLEDVSAQKGNSAGTKKGTTADGSFESRSGAGPTWIHPNSVAAVLAYANDAYRNGHRDDARAVLEPYYAQLSQVARATLSNELAGQLTVMESLAVRMANNLDFFGNPPGWLPRLNLLSNFTIFQDMRRLASEVLYYSDKAEREYDQLDGTSELVSRTSDAVARQMKATGDLLQREYAEVRKAKDALDRVLESYKEKKRDIDDLAAKAENDAIGKIQGQRLFKAFMKFAAGITKAIPVGQPFTGLAGSVLDTVADIDWNADDLGREVGKGLKQFGTATETFLEKNKDVLVKSASGGARERLNTLEDKLTDAQRGIDTVDAKLDTYKSTIESRWSAVRQTQVAERKQQIAALDTDIADKNAKIAALKTKQASTKLQQSEAADLKSLQSTFDAANATRDAYIALQEASKETVVAAKARLEKALKDDETTASKEALDALRARVAQITDLTNQKTDVEKEVKEREDQRKSLLESLAGVGDGIKLAGEGLTAAMSPVTGADDEVKRLTEQILRSSYRVEYEKLKRDFEEMNARRLAAISELSRHQHIVSTCVAEIATNLAEMTALSRQQQSLGVLDASVRCYLRGMSQRARDTLHWSIYHLAKAWQYEYLSDVPDDFYNFGTWLTKLRQYAEASNKLLGKDDFSKDAYQTVEKAALNDQFIGLARQILTTRQSLQGAAQNTKDVTLSPAHLETLNRTGGVAINLVRDFDLGSFDDIDKRIVGLALTAFKLADGAAPHLSVDIRFMHAGESVLLGKARDPRTGGPQYQDFWFRPASGDDPISWGFTYNHADRETDTHGIAADVKDSEQQKQEAALLKGLLGSETSSYSEYFPSFFSDLTIRLNPGHFRSGVIPDIKELTFKATFSGRGTRG